jgi:hypothetical protein
MSVKINPLNEKIYLYLIAGIVLVLTCFVRFRFLEVPLERDEGEYAYIGWQLLHGILPYAESNTMKLPGIHFVYAIILTIFGQTHSSIHLALLFTNIATSFLIFLLGKRLYDEPGGIFAGASFLVMTLSPSVQGFWANSEHFVILFAIGGILLMMIALDNEDKRYLFLSGILLGCAILIKQHAVFFAVFGFFYIVYLKKQAKNFVDIYFKVGFFMVGVLTPLISVVLIYFATGNFDEFWFWTFKYASEYVSLTSPNRAVGQFLRGFDPILSNNFWIFLLSLIGVVSAGWNKTIRSKYVFSFGLLLFSFIAITPGFYFRPHYFILLMPSLSLYAGIGVSSFLELSPTRHGLKRRSLLCAVAIILAIPLFTQKNFFFKMSVFEITRHTYGLNPFSESIEISNYINENTNEDDVIAILGSEPQIYFYSKRKPATRFLYMYPLTEEHRYARNMQTEMIKAIENSEPKYIVVVNVPTSWLWRKKSSRLVIAWAQDYLEKKYRVSGVVNMPSGEKPIYYFNDQAIENYLGFLKNDSNLQHKANLFIYRKKEMGLT